MTALLLEESGAGVFVTLKKLGKIPGPIVGELCLEVHPPQCNHVPKFRIPWLSMNQIPWELLSPPNYILYFTLVSQSSVIHINEIQISL